MQIYKFGLNIKIINIKLLICIGILDDILTRLLLDSATRFRSSDIECRFQTLEKKIFNFLEYILSYKICVQLAKEEFKILNNKKIKQKASLSLKL